MSLETRMTQRASNVLFAAAWRRGQRLRDKVERLSSDFFQDLVRAGINVLGPPNLGKFTPSWEPLSESWEFAKGGEEFYFHTGALGRALLRKSTVGTFGRPTVEMSFNGKVVKVTAAPPPKKYGSELGPFILSVTPFPRATNLFRVESLVADPGTETFFKLVNPKGRSYRPLVSPFLQWYLTVKLKKAIKS